MHRATAPLLCAAGLTGLDRTCSGRARTSRLLVEPRVREAQLLARRLLGRRELLQLVRLRHIQPGQAVLTAPPQQRPPPAATKRSPREPHGCAPALTARL
jgi:hypothetical protein